MDYRPDNAAREAKQKEIEALLVAFAEANSAVDPARVKHLIGSFVTLTPPMDPPLLMNMMIMSDLGRGGGASRKPGNIRLNSRRLFDLVPDVTLAGAGTIEARWLVPFAALYIWMKLWNVAAVNLQEEDAFVVYSLWYHRNEDDRIPEDEAFSKTEALAKKHELPVVTKEKFDQIVNKLLFS